MDLPKGVSFEREPNGFVLEATTRNVPGALVFLLIAIFWGTIAFSAVQDSLLIVLPLGLFSLSTSVLTIMFTLGRIRLSRRGDQLEIFTGAGPIG